ncbi:hypothetical protein DERF_001939 [Dermatophagoides farinae]|uniref:Uncharacterized protein n=1 Tax=Dermatophagoides farinae TaxID=6954 RepID=A0A922IBY1_DERFA|nr:hypothetical protein DERF_001939 [Dermatophagoides farinae]
MKKDKRLCAIRSSIEQHLHINADIHHQYSNNLCIISVDTNLNQVLTRYRCNREDIKPKKKPNMTKRRNHHYNQETKCGKQTELG